MNGCAVEVAGAGSGVPKASGRTASRPSLRRLVSSCGVSGGRILWRQGAFVALALVSQMAGPYAAATMMGALILWACRNTRSAIQAVTISVLVTFASPALVGDQLLIGLLKWVLLFVSLGTILLSWKHQPATRAKRLACLGLFVVIALGLTLAVSGNRSLSLLKLGTFAAGVTVAFLGLRDRRYPPDYWLSWFTTVFTVVLLLSLPLEFLPAGRHLNGSAFQGIFRHPNSYAVYIAPIAAYAIVRLLVERAGGWFMLALTPWAWYSLFASGCRTAFLAVGLSVLATILSLVVFPRKARRSGLRRSTILTICLVGVVLLSVLATSAGPLADAFGKFVLKGDIRGLGASRREQVESLLASIDENPLTGVGFGLSPATVEQSTQRDELTGVPVGAYTEQGFLPLAVLHQLGIIGAVPLALFLAAVAFPIAKYGSPAVLALFWTALFVNFGEMIFFSIGGLGMHMWLLIASCLGQSLASPRSVKV